MVISAVWSVLEQMNSVVVWSNVLTAFVVWLVLLMTSQGSRSFFPILFFIKSAGLKVTPSLIDTHLPTVRAMCSQRGIWANVVPLGALWENEHSVFLCCSI